MKYPIYLDYNATTPCDKEVIEAMIPWFGEHFGNAASNSHPYGWLAEDAVETAREQIANLIGAKPKEIVFTSGATESINLAVKGIFEFYKGQKQHYITCQTEHKAVLDTFKSLESKGAEVTYLPVNQFGDIDLNELKSNIQPHTKMLAFMWANNETGLIHPMSDLIKLAKEHDIILFTDAVQAAGKIPISTGGIHLMAISAHKMYGPKGVGALYIRHNHHLPKPSAMIEGGGHEKGFRSGTLNVPGIVGFGKAAQLRPNKLIEDAERLGSLRDALEKRLLSIVGATLNGSRNKRLSHVSNISFSGVEGEELLRRVNKEIAVSSGSACTSILPKPSHVLAAMGLGSDLGRASIRFSLGKETTEKDIAFAADHVLAIVKELRKSNPL
ncbi:cysteine desulfurase family protein [Aquiflexum lacus]|uniref:cysteine desulfurase family protein n=1 Tax=Aquiflexum lacus TaxID=2483805 RepID=UPI0018943ADD|nr:cysteine desulfurase family protein [Aquiflexum lacus]